MVFRTVKERTSDIALELAKKNIKPDKIHIIENIKPFSKAMEKILGIEYDGDSVVFMDSDCLILEDMRPFLESNEYAYVDCFVLDKFRGYIHAGVHITRIDVIKKMQTLESPENDIRLILRPESRLRNLALAELKEGKTFKRFRIFHDFFQQYKDIFSKYVIRELRSRNAHQRAKLNSCINNWHNDDLDFFVAKQAIKYARNKIPEDVAPQIIAEIISNLEKISKKQIKKMHLKKKKALEFEEVLYLKGALNALGQFDPKAEKVFCIGLSRTSTKSLTASLDILGYNISHYPTDKRTFEELYSGNLNFTLLQDFDGISDITVAPYYAQLDKLFPNSKFILSVREKESWLRSMENHWKERSPFDDPKISEIHLKVRRFLRASVYGTYIFNRERLSYVYDLHIKNVLDFFKDKPNSLLILDICAGEGWEKLCKFLDKPLIDEEFPNIKTSEHLFDLI
ncbi:MAG: sulfotransferase [Candidatus Lokiarchaeota archaeon]